MPHLAQLRPFSTPPVLCPLSFSLAVSSLAKLLMRVYASMSKIIWIYYLFLFTGLSWGTDDHSLREAFTNFGEVTEGQCVLEFLIFNSHFFYDSAIIQMCKFIDS